MKIKNKRRGKFITNLELKVERGISKVFKKMASNFHSVASLAFTKDANQSPIDILVELGFKDIGDILEDGTITAYAFSYKTVADTMEFAFNLEKINKQALMAVQKRREYLKGMKKYTVDSLYASLDKALKGDLSYEEYLKESENIFILDKNRARRIAIHEIGSVYVEASQNAVRDIQMETRAKVKKRWNSVNDKRVTRGCRHNERQGYVPVDFRYDDVDGLGGGEAPPRFVGCRCALDYEVED